MKEVKKKKDVERAKNIILTGNTIVDACITYNYSISYKVQDEHSETIKLENKTIEDLINKIYQNLLIELSQSI